MSDMNRYHKHGILFALFIYVLWAIAYSYFDFNREKQRLYQSIDSQLENAALLAPALLPENFHHKTLAKQDLTQQQDFSNIRHLSELTDNSDIEYVYTLILQDDKVFFTSSSATQQEWDSKIGFPAFFDQYENVDPGVYQVFKSKQKAFLEFTDQWGTFRSVFIPQYSADGTLFITSADISISDIQALLNNHFQYSLLVTGLFLLFAYPIYFLSTRRIKGFANDLEHQIEQKTSQLKLNKERLDYALKVARQGWFDLNLKKGELQVGDEYVRLLGYEPSEFQPSLDNWKTNIHPEDQVAVEIAFQKMLTSSKAVEIEYRRQSKNGDWVWLYSIGEVVEFDDSNKAVRVIGIQSAITKRKQNEQVLRILAESGADNENIFQLMVKQLANSQNMRYAFIGSFSESIENQVDTLAVWMGEAYGDNFSYSVVDTPCQSTAEDGMCFYPDNIQHLFPKDHMLVEMEACSYQGVALKNSQHKVIGLLAILDDRPMVKGTHTSSLLKSLAVRAAIELERIESDKQLALAARVFNDTREAIMLTDINGCIKNVNPAFTEITGYELGDVVDQHPSMLSSSELEPDFYINIWNTIKIDGFWQGEISNRKKNGESYIESLTISALKDEAGNILHYLGMFSDITHSKQQQDKLEFLAHYDELTQLPNRSLFADRFSQAVSHCKRYSTLLAICFLDLDDFKPVNDQYGHEVGDQLLIEVAKRIATEIRAEDTVSRQGGDEFAILLEGLASVEEYEPILTRLHVSLAQPYLINGRQITIGASSGVTIYPMDNSDIDTLLRHADKAMYQAKLTGKNRYQLFNAEHDLKTLQQQGKLNEIQQALLNGELCLYYQPKVNMKTGKVFGAEALLRWQHPEKGLIPPLTFLPLIAGTALEILVGEWVINQALKQMLCWQEQAIELEISVNISSYHLQDKHFIEQLNSAFSLVPEIKSNHFQLEILESSALGDLQTINQIIKLCRDRIGVKIALDDFGTGYSSLTHLRSLAATTIKIDQSFVRDVLDDPSDYTIIDGVIGLAASFGREVIAEGVETTEHGLMLLMMGCNEAQGYGIARPMPASEISSWLSQYQPNRQWITMANQSFTVKDTQLTLLKLALHQWHDYFEKNILSTSEKIEYWPIMAKQKCPCGTWAKRARQNEYFSEEWLTEFEQAHDEAHNIANKLLLKHRNGELDAARSELAQFHKPFELMHDLINVEIKA